MNRRGLLGALMGGLMLDPERLLWVPGRKLISIPAVPPRTDKIYDWLDGGRTTATVIVINPIDSPLVAFLREHPEYCVQVPERAKRIEWSENDFA